MRVLSSILALGTATLAMGEAKLDLGGSVIFGDAGNVGIGTNNPDTFVEVRQADASPELRITGEQYGETVKLTLQAATYNNGYGYVGTTSAHPLSFGTGSNGEAMTIKTSGQVEVKGALKVNADLSPASIQGFMKTFSLGMMANPIKKESSNAHVRLDIDKSASYYKGFTFEVFMEGGKDWSGHGFATYYGKFMVQIMNTGEHYRVAILDEYSISFRTFYYGEDARPIKWSGYHLVEGDASTPSKLYLYFISGASTSGADAGWQPNVQVISYGASGVHQGVSGDCTGAPNTPAFPNRYGPAA